MDFMETDFTPRREHGFHEAFSDGARIDTAAWTGAVFPAGWNASIFRLPECGAHLRLPGKHP
jgi:hypothetical protein